MAINTTNASEILATICKNGIVKKEEVLELNRRYYFVYHDNTDDCVTFSVGIIERTERYSPFIERMHREERIHRTEISVLETIDLLQYLIDEVTVL